MLIKSIKNSINKKFFLITSLILIICSMLIYLFIVIVMPISYENYIDKKVYNITSSFSNKSIYNFPDLFTNDTFYGINYAYIVFDSNKKYVSIIDSEYLLYTFDDSSYISEFNEESFLLSYKYKKDELSTDELLKYLSLNFKLYIPDSLANANVKYIKVPITLKDNTTYTMYLFWGLQPINDASKVLINLLPYVLIMILLVSFIASYIYSKIITKPIIKISKTAKEMSSTNLNAKCDVKQSDEIGVLSSSLNTLSTNLSSSLDKLKTTNSILEKEIEKEREIDRLRRDFFNSASHELKTPITIIKGQLEGMLYNIGIYKNREKYLNRCLEVTESMEDLVKEILTISRMESSNFKLNLLESNLSNVLKECVYYYSDLIKSKNITLTINIEDNLYIKIDTNLIKKALSNIISNAINYSPNNSKISISLNNKTLEIINYNSSIPENELNNLFHAFYRVDKSRNSNTGGNGLGLYIVKIILDLHNFKYSIKNIDNGVCFTIIL